MEMSIRSESAVNLMHSFDLCKSWPRDPPDVIVLHTRRRNYPIKLENFLRHSKHIQQMTPNVPRVVDLTCYNVEAVRTLADYLCDVDVRNFRLSGYMLVDLFQLCQIFDVAGLKEFLSVYMIENIEQGRDSPSAFVYNASIVLSDWTLIGDDRVRQRLYAVAAQLFPQIQNSSYLGKFPLPLMVHLLGRCELRVRNEAEVAMIILRWLQLATFTLDDVQVLFSTVRSAFLTAADRRHIDARANETGFVSEVIEALNAQLNSNRNARCCIIKDHVRGEWRRCGMPKDADRRLAQSMVSLIDLRLVIPRAAQCGNSTYYEHQLFDCVEENCGNLTSSGPQLQNVKVDELSALRKSPADSAKGLATASSSSSDSSIANKESGSTKNLRSSSMARAKASIGVALAPSSATTKVFFEDAVLPAEALKTAGQSTATTATAKRVSADQKK